VRPPLFARSPERIPVMLRSLLDLRDYSLAHFGPSLSQELLRLLVFREWLSIPLAGLEGV